MTTHGQHEPRRVKEGWNGPRRLADGGHFSVLLREAIDALDVKAGGRYLDGTFGGGGHSRALLAVEPRIDCLYALDADPAAIERARDLAGAPLGRDRLVPVHGNFGDLAAIAERERIRDLDGILLDLGVSSFQLDQAERGFSFRFDAPLDMRFDPERGLSAADLVNSLDQEDLASLIWRYGDERQSRRIAGAIVQARSVAPIETTGQLSAIVSDAVGGRRGKGIHPATKTFQALRIAVNRELDALDNVLAASVSLLAPGGRLVVISFHSLEDRAVKRFIGWETATCICPPDQPVCTCDHQPTLRRIGKPVRPSAVELEQNQRSRSAIMRVAERLPRTSGGRQSESERGI
ncbi:MAG: 16S rRNA (cytosine(1402)-N(4))-methyltransferase RsmH [Thermomicrobiales bacterium]